VRQKQAFQYAYCNNNPVNAVDPDGRSTYVIANADGTYRVVGGDLDDKDYNIYAFSAGKNGELVKTSIGRSSSITSFYNSDDGAWMTGSVINPNDNSGVNFLNDIVQNNPEMGDYTTNATTGQRYDFKVTNGTGEHYSNPIDYYRGMPIGKDKDGTVIYSSARDVGNIAAGYVAGSHGVNWDKAREAFDALESQQKGYKTIEGISTQNAQRVGWESGWNDAQKYPIWSSYYILRDIPFDIKYFYKKLKGK